MGIFVKRTKRYQHPEFPEKIRLCHCEGPESSNRENAAVFGRRANCP